MSQEQSPAVVEFGPASGPPDTPVVPRPMLSRFLSGARLDNRAVPALAGLGAVAVFISLVSPWQTSAASIGITGPPTNQEVTLGLTDLGGWSPAYLVGVLAVAACAALVLFGTAEVRRPARLAGLGVSGALLAIVVAAAVQLSQDSLVYPAWINDVQRPDPSISSGLYLAFVGVAALGGSLYLADRLPAPAHAAGADAVAHAGEADSATGSLWRWRRAGPPAPDPEEPPPPADLTVMPARPFVHGPGSGGT